MKHQEIDNKTLSNNGFGVMAQLQQSAQKFGLGRRLNPDLAKVGQKISSARDTVQLSSEAMQALSQAQMSENSSITSFPVSNPNENINLAVNITQAQETMSPASGDIINIQSMQLQGVNLQDRGNVESNQINKNALVNLQGPAGRMSIASVNVMRSINDADMAMESASLTKSQVLQQASSSMLSQSSGSHAASALAMSLFGGGGSVGSEVSEDGTATLRGFDISVGETQTDENGNITTATGTIDLSSVGGGIVEANLEFYGGRIVGATATESTTTTVAGAEITLNADIGFRGLDMNAEGAEGDAFTQSVATALNEAAQSGTTSLNRAVTNLNELEASGSDLLQSYTTELGRAGAAGDMYSFFSATESAGDQMGQVLSQMSRVSDSNVSDFLMTTQFNGVDQQDILTQMEGIEDNNVDAFVNATYNSGNNAGQFLTQLQRVDSTEQSAFIDQVAGAGGNASSLVGQMSRVGDEDLSEFMNLADSAGNQRSFLQAMGRVDDADVGSFLSAANAAGDDLDRFASRARSVGEEDVGNLVAAADNAGSGVGDLLDQMDRVTNNDTKRDFLSVAASAGDQTNALLTQMDRVNSSDLNNYVAAAESAQADGRLESFLGDMSQVSDEDLGSYLDVAATASSELAGAINTGSIEIGGVTVNNLQTSTNDAGEAIVTGQVTLPGGLGAANVQLDISDGEVVGAFTTDDTLSFKVAGNSLTMKANADESLFTLGTDGSFSFDGSITAKIGDQEITVNDANLSFGTDENGSEYIRAGGSYSTSDQTASATVEFNKNGTVSAEMGFNAELFGGALPGLDKVTGFLETMGVEIDTSASASISYNSQQESFAFDVAGISGSYNNTTKDFSVGGLSAGAGISLGLENLTINASTGYVKGDVSAGVGVGAGGLGIDISLANFSFEYDPNDNGAITLSGSVGLAGANLSTTVELERTDDLYGVDSISFAANYDPALGEAAQALAQDMATGLNNAYSTGATLGNQAVSELSTLAGDNLNNFTKGLANAGTDVSNFVGKTGELVGEDLDNFLTSAGNAGDQLGTLLEALDAPDMNDMSSFLKQTANMDNLQAELGKGLNSFKNVLGDLLDFLPKLPDLGSLNPFK